MSLLFLVLFQIAGDIGRPQKVFDALGGLDRAVGAEHQIRDIFQLDTPRKLAAQESVMTVQGPGEVIAAFFAESTCENGGVLQIRAHPNLGHRYDLPSEFGVFNILGSKDLRKRVPEQLACAKLPLRGAFSRMRFHDAFSEAA
jgi:hypothetical protein